MSPIFVAIDTQDVHRARSRSPARSAAVAAGLKLGLEFFCANGDEGVLRIAEHETPIFLDLKLHDIPNTVAESGPGARSFGTGDPFRPFGGGEGR